MSFKKITVYPIAPDPVTREVYIETDKLTSGFVEGAYVIFELTSGQTFYFKGTIAEFKTALGL